MKCFDKNGLIDLEAKYGYNVIFLYCILNRDIIRATVAYKVLPKHFQETLWEKSLKLHFISAPFERGVGRFKASGSSKRHWLVIWH